ncbi:MAG: shikimate dehydrogenase [Acidimicrobiales bacterium]
MTSAPISGHTQLAAVIGHPVRHSLSPAIHNAGFASCGLDWVYLAFDVAPGGAPGALDAMRSLGIVGLSVTMPHKDAVAAAVDETTPAAANLGAVNCVINRDGHLTGDNTDGDGFIAGLEADLALDVAGMSCVIVGAGGAARAVIDALVRNGAASVGVVNRTPDKAETAASLAGGRGRVAGPDEIGTADLVVNATSVGMAGTAGEGVTPFDTSLLRSGQVVVDLVYEPSVTPLMAAAQRAGCRVGGGLAMLVGQAAVAFTAWTGVDAPVSDMTAAAKKVLAARGGH